MKLWNYQRGLKKTNNSFLIRKRPSIGTVFLLCQGIVFVAVLVVLISTYVVIIRLSFSNFSQQQKSIVANSTTSLMYSLNNFERAVLRVSQKTLEQRELFQEDTGQNTFGKIKVFREINEICELDSEIGFIFTTKPGHFFISYALNPQYDTLKIRDYLNSLSFSDRPIGQWVLTNIDQTMYLAYYNYSPGENVYTGNLILLDSFFFFFVNAFEENSWVSVTDILGQTRNYSSERADVADKGFYFSFTQDIAYGLFLQGNIPYSYGDLFSDYAIFVFSLFVFLCIASLVIQSITMYFIHTKPVILLTKELRNIKEKEDLTSVRLFATSRTSEIEELKSVIKYLLDEIVAKKMELYQQQIDQQEAELLFLRAQLRPHFYLNAISTVDAMTYQNRTEDIQKFLNALSVYMRYMMQMEKAIVTLKEELKNIEAYIAMQKIRYPEKIVSCIQVSNRFFDYNIPRLTLYTVVENSIKHAMGEKTLFLLISAQKTENGVCVTVEDNGNGYDDAILSLYNGDTESHIEKEIPGHIGLFNVSRTLELVYGQKHLLQLKNSKSHGAITQLFYLDGKF